VQTTLVVGLGWHSGDALAEIYATYQHNQQQDQRRLAASEPNEINTLEHLRLLWLTPTEQPDPPALQTEQAQCRYKQMPLSLTAAQLRTIYFDPQVRCWSGSNWKLWRANILTNRLWGKLALHQHYLTVESEVKRLLSQPPAASGLQVFLIAPLYDVFASGMLMDVAFMLYEQALPYDGRNYGMFLLPNDDNPLASAQQHAVREHQQATTYATLREIYNYHSPMNFYINYSDRQQVEQWSQGTEGSRVLSDTSPFASGECFLFDKRSTEHITRSIAQYIHLMGAGGLHDYFSPKHVTAGGSVGALNIVSEDDRSTTSDYQRLRTVVDALAVLMSAADARDVASLPTVNVQQLMTINFRSIRPAIITDNLPNVATTASVSTLSSSQVDAEYSRSMTQLGNITIELGREVQQHQARHSEQVDHLVQTHLKTQYVTLPQLDYTHETLLRDADRSQRQANAKRQETESQLKHAADELRTARQTYEFSQRKAASDFPLWASSVVIALVAVLLFLVGGNEIGRASCRERV